MQQMQKPIAQKAEGGAKGQSDLKDVGRKLWAKAKLTWLKTSP